jgi:hypothetical protein
MVVRLLLLRRMHFFLRATQKLNTVKCSVKAILLCFSASFFENLQFGSLRDFPMCDFLSAPSFFLKCRRRMRGMKVGVVGDDA